MGIDPSGLTCVDINNGCGIAQLISSTLFGSGPPPDLAVEGSKALLIGSGSVAAVGAVVVLAPEVPAVMAAGTALGQTIGSTPAGLAALSASGVIVEGALSATGAGASPVGLTGGNKVNVVVETVLGFTSLVQSTSQPDIVLPPGSACPF